MPLKVATWNLENSSKLVSNNPSPDVLNRRQRIRNTIESINPDILCIQEGPKGEIAIDVFCAQVLNQQWVPILLRQSGQALGIQDKEYKIAGDQWIWFLVKASLEKKCRLQSPQVWQNFTGMKTWKVNFWGNVKPSRHSHYRHPQVLIYDLDNGQRLEIIGVHLKSKFNTNPITRDGNGNLIGDYLNDAISSRIKMATEARDVRQYVAAKFDQVAHPGIMIMGDCNDGPGQDYFEENYLFFDLINNLQGSVLISERFFNHALFDFPDDLCWTVKFEDKFANPPGLQSILLDHILISQPLCRGELPLVVKEYAGRIEHEAYKEFNAGSNSKTKTSDHCPVSCKLDDV
jgi:hypothetical protein